MKCGKCLREINRGKETKKVVTYFTLPDGEQFRHCVFDRTGDPPAGARLFKTLHYLCDKVMEKRMERGGDPIKGRALGNDQDTAYTFVHINADDLEAMGITAEQAAAMTTAKLVEKANEGRRIKVAMAARDAIEERRADDPGYEPPTEADWRTQTVADIDVINEGRSKHCRRTGIHEPHTWDWFPPMGGMARRFNCPGVEHDHEKHCCSEHGTHTMPHKGCILR